MFGIGMSELLVILVIVLVVFGAGKLPEIGAGLGQGIRNFKKGARDINEIEESVKKTDKEEEQKK